MRSILTYQTIRSPFQLKVYNYNIEVSLPSELALYGLIVTMLRSHKDWEAHGCDFDEIAQPFDEIRACLTCFQAAHRALCIFTPPVFFPPESSNYKIRFESLSCSWTTCTNLTLSSCNFYFSNNFNPNQCILHKNPTLEMLLNPGTLIIFFTLKGPNTPRSQHKTPFTTENRLPQPSARTQCANLLKPRISIRTPRGHLGHAPYCIGTTALNPRVPCSQACYWPVLPGERLGAQRSL